MDTSHWHQELGLVRPMQELIMSSTPAISTAAASNRSPPTLTTIPVEKKPRPPKAKAVNCPRCKSTKTKFCYYNNYSLSQPRYFCKTCRRYWTEGGTLRNVPIGGGSRKNKKRILPFSRSSSDATTGTVGTTVLANASAVGATDNKLHSELMAPLAFQLPEFSGFPNLEGANGNISNVNNTVSAMNLLRRTVLLGGGATGIGGFAPMGMPAGIPAYNAALGLQEFRPAMGQNFPLDAMGGGLIQSFSFEGLKPASDATSGSILGQFEPNRGLAGDATTGYWNGMIGGGGPWIG